MGASFGSIISAARKKKKLSQRQLAARILKEDLPQTISAQYLNDIEHDRRNPPSEFIIAQLATELGLSGDRLCLVAGTLPAEDQKTISSAQPEIVQSAWTTFRRSIRRKS